MLIEENLNALGNDRARYYSAYADRAGNVYLAFNKLNGPATPADIEESRKKLIGMLDEDKIEYVAGTIQTEEGKAAGMPAICIPSRSVVYVMGLVRCNTFYDIDQVMDAWKEAKGMTGGHTGAAQKAQMQPTGLVLSDDLTLPPTIVQRP